MIDTVSKHGALVSVVIPSYNHARFVQDTIQSVIDQDYDNIELIIIDDGSVDNSIEIIKEMIPICESRFTRFEFRHRPNKGLSATLNEALEWCKGVYFAPIASDDMVHPCKTTVQVTQLLSKSDISIAGIFGDISTFHSEMEVDFPDISMQLKSKIYSFNDVFLRRAKLPAPTAMLNLSKVKAIGGYDIKTKIEDFYLWLKLTEHGDRLLFINATLSMYRRHTGNLSQNSDVMLAGVKDILKEYSDHPCYKEALARSYLVHAGDLAADKAPHSFKYLLIGIKAYPGLLISRSIVVYFYRLFIGLKGVQ